MKRTRRVRKTKQSKKIFLATMGPKKIIIANMILIGILYILIASSLVSILFDQLKIFGFFMFLGAVDLLILISFISMLLIELKNKKWYYFFTIILIGIFLVFTVSFAGCWLLLNELNNSNDIVQRTSTDKWEKDTNIFFDESKLEVTKSIQMEEADIVDSKDSK
ncbi:hypothetical protein [Mycoplasma sp. Mirounga ES2805-ORL]|uniref:hypothetical protein n=1 Tax=Mycoplasma sp. Mirounga ES2805-ORL TaxID=754514 RepID=UPI00197B8DA7|nr:hypothetical protein [Mycoplasma sp. Mirounga ES2805-ORL]QSF13889.1 hypothetical protein JXZ90_01135 [Mycoplasma sp. Mirounga ES2805-ORL]